MDNLLRPGIRLPDTACKDGTQGPRENERVFIEIKRPASTNSTSRELRKMVPLLLISFSAAED